MTARPTPGVFADKIAATFNWHDNDRRPRECEPDYSLERKIAAARREMGEARWAALQAEWSATPCRQPNPALFDCHPEERN